MDKFNFVRDGGSKLPPGFIFQPTDEEIVFQYLANKILSSPLPATVIPEINNIFTFNPWDLPGDMEKDKYFFRNKEPSYRNIVNKGNRATCGGFWRVTGYDKQIICSKRMPIVGIKRTLVFYKGKNSSANRTDWFMHLYGIALPRNSDIENRKHSSQGCSVQIGKWDLCHVFLKKKNTKAEVFYDGRLMSVEESDDADSCCASSSSDSGPGSSSSSGSSVFSEVSSSSVNSET